MNKKYQFDITYLYGNGRKQKIQSEDIHGKEFFYGYPYFEKKGYKLNIIETTEQKSHKFTKSILKYLDKFFAKFSKLTFYMNVLISKETLSQIFKSKNIVTSNHGIGMSLFLYIMLMKKFKKINFIVILSGLFEMKKSNLIVMILRKLIFFLFLKTVDNLVFTSRSEYEYAKKKYYKVKNKFVCLPFCLDLDFWKPSKKPNFLQKNGILFIGNNGHRDFDLAIELAKNLKFIHFTFITNRIKNEDLKSKNVSNILGDWNRGYLSDNDIKNYFEAAKLVILPIKNTLVSSGQSAGLQAASVGTPVMTTKTKGFWDYKNYKNDKNIIFVDNNDKELWISKINEYYHDDLKLKKISEMSIELINKKYSLNMFDHELEKLIKL